MKISRLILNNYRGARSLSLELHEKLNVFVGVNGSGKSSILDAAAILLSWVVNRIIKAGTPGRPITENDIANNKFFATLEAKCDFHNQIVTWKLVKTRKGHPGHDERSMLSDLTEFTKDLQNQISSSKEHVNLPVFVYYPVNRSVVDISLRRKRNYSLQLFTAFDDALTSRADFKTFFEWFREREDLENENRKYVHSFFSPEESQFPDPQLEAVRDAVTRFIPEFSNLTVRRNPLRMEVEKNRKRFTVNQLSDGEKCLMAMVGDLARRMAIANPERKKPLEGEGIVLIDEIDLHLHPHWQRMVVPGLRKVFPNCQFLVSTHSPHVITHVEPENLFLLRLEETGIVAEKPTESYGKNVDRILVDLMGLDTTRPSEVHKDLKKVYDLIHEEHLKEARESINRLKEEIGDDPELVKAEVLIRRKEIIGK